MPNYPIAGSAVPQRQQMGGSRSGGYTGLGNIQQFGYANPSGPYGMMGAQPAGGGAGGAGGRGGAAGGAESVARNYLTGVVQGTNTPYNEATKTAMYGRASGMNAAAEGAQNRQIGEQAAMGGASPNDPSYANLMRQSMAQRQGANVQAAGDIDRTANLANQQTQQAAAGTLMNSEDERNALQQGYNQRALQTAMGYLYGGGGQSGGSVNNFNLAQERQTQGNYDWAQNQADRERQLQEAREDQQYNQWRTGRF